MRAELVAAVGRDEVTVSAAADVVALDPDEQAAQVARGPAAVRQKVKELREAKPKKKATRSEDTSRRRTTRNRAIGSRTAKRTFFLRRAGWSNTPCGPGWRTRRRSTAWPRFGRSRSRRSIGSACTLGRTNGGPAQLLASFEADLIDLAIVTEHPERWTVCCLCHGAGQEDNEVCSSCRGRGFRTMQLEPTISRVGGPSPDPAHSEVGRPTGTAEGANKRGEAESTTRPRRVRSRSA